MSQESRKIVQVDQFRKDMKAIGYSVRTRRNSDFIAATVRDANGNPINKGNVLTPDHFEKHKAFYDYKAGHSVRDDTWIVTF